MNALYGRFEDKAGVSGAVVSHELQALHARLVGQVAQAQLVIELLTHELDEHGGPVAARQRQRLDLVDGDARLEHVLARYLNAIDVYHVQVRVGQPQDACVRRVFVVVVVVIVVGMLRAERRAHDVHVVARVEMDELARRPSDGQELAVALIGQVGRVRFARLAHLPQLEMLVVLEKHELVARVHKCFLFEPCIEIIQ